MNRLRRDLRGQVVMLRDYQKVVVVGGRGAWANAPGCALVVAPLYNGHTRTDDGYNVYRLVGAEELSEPELARVAAIRRAHDIAEREVDERE